VLDNQIPSPSIGRALRLEEPPYVIWVKAPIENDTITVAFSHIAGGQQRSITEREYIIGFQDFTEVVGAIARSFYERAVADYYRELKNRLDLQLQGKEANRTLLLGKKYIKVAEGFILSREKVDELREVRTIRTRLISKLGIQRAKKQNPLEGPAATQECRDMDLILVQYSENFNLYHPKNVEKVNKITKDDDHSPATDDDYFYAIWIKEGKLYWQAVIPQITIGKIKGKTIFGAVESNWQILEEHAGCVDLKYWRSNQPLALEQGRSIILEYLPQEGIKAIVPALVDKFEQRFIERVEEMAKDQIMSDGELILLWPYILEVASGTSSSPLFVEQLRSVVSEYSALEVQGKLTTVKAERLAQRAVDIFMQAYRKQDEILIETADFLTHMRLSKDSEIASIGTKAMMKGIIEPLADTFLEKDSEVRFDFNLRVVEICRQQREGKFIDEVLKRLGFLDEKSLRERKDIVRKIRYLHPSRRDKIKKIFILSRITIGADIAITNRLITGFLKTFPFAEIVLFGNRRTLNEICGGENRIRIESLPVLPKGAGTAIDRFLPWAEIVKVLEEEIKELKTNEDFIIFDPASRIGRVGVLPFIHKDKELLHYYFFEGNLTSTQRPVKRKSDLYQEFAQNCFGISLEYPTVFLKKEDVIFAQKIWESYDLGKYFVIALQFGVGGDNNKRIWNHTSEEEIVSYFEKSLIQRLLAEGHSLLIDKGFGWYEETQINEILKNLNVPIIEILCLPNREPIVVPGPAERIYKNIENKEISPGRLAEVSRVKVVYRTLDGVALVSWEEINRKEGNILGTVEEEKRKRAKRVIEDFYFNSNFDKLVKPIFKNFREAEQIVLSCQVPLGKLGALLGNTQVYVGYDSQGQHMAAAKGVNGVVVFAGYPEKAPYFPDHWAPVGRNCKVEIIEKGRGPYSFQAQKMIVEEVVEKVRKLTSSPIRIIATLGPSTEGKERAMIEKGMNMVRISLGHGTREKHIERIERITYLSRKMGVPVDIILDLSGFKMRIGELKNPPVLLQDNSEVILTMEKIIGDHKMISVNYPTLAQEILRQEPEKILLDGVGRLIELKVISVTTTDIRCRVLKGGLLWGRKGIYVRGISLNLPLLTEKDQYDLKFIAEQGNIKYVALSFVRSFRDIQRVEEILEQYGAKGIKIIAKIETEEALKNIEEIMRVSDVIMVARKDLGIQISVEKLPYYQQIILERCKKSNVPVIIASRLLESMRDVLREPSEDEIRDIHIGIIQGTWGFMLSDVTGIGKYPVETVAKLVKIIEDFVHLNKKSLGDFKCSSSAVSLFNFPKVKIDNFEGAPGSLREIIRNLYREMSKAKYPNGRHFIKYEWNPEEFIIEFGDKLYFRIVGIFAREEYVKAQQSKEAPKYLPQDILRHQLRQKSGQPCFLCRKDLLQFSLGEIQEYLIWPNSRPAIKGDILLSTKDKVSQTLTKKRVKDMLSSLRLLGSGVEGFFQTTGASVYHFHVH
ncbi:MAG TPA: pyruvate kinase, partial [Candidatus Atribacteria bacterium]|nr:pyruvate kinase [Candidatus Atribacteria bacterium]